jgi:hypothetical protein
MRVMRAGIASRQDVDQHAEVADGRGAGRAEAAQRGQAGKLLEVVDGVGGDAGLIDGAQEVGEAGGLSGAGRLEAAHGGREGTDVAGESRRHGRTLQLGECLREGVEVLGEGVEVGGLGDLLLKRAERRLRCAIELAQRLDRALEGRVNLTEAGLGTRTVNADLDVITISHRGPPNYRPRLRSASRFAFSLS